MDNAINDKLDRLIVTVDKIDTTLSDGSTGLKTRVALLEQTDKSRTWRERLTIAAVIGLVGKIIIGII